MAVCFKRSDNNPLGFFDGYSVAGVSLKHYYNCILRNLIYLENEEFLVLRIRSNLGSTGSLVALIRYVVCTVLSNERKTYSLKLK